LLDGLPLNEAHTGVAKWNGMLPENIERIEVARGPFSSLYGGNAMGGVVNMLTKMPEKREINFQGGAGSDSYYTAYGSYGDKLFNRLSIFASYGYQGSEGYPTNLIVKTPSTVSKPTAVAGVQPTTSTSGSSAFLIGDGGNNNWYRDSGVIKLAYDLTENSRATFSY
jgi:iron complex outermembrane recepter protein